jgi:hypothetical protein
MKADTEFPGVGSVDKKPRLKLRVKRIVGQGDNTRSFCRAFSLVRSMSESCFPVVQQRLSVQIMPSKVLKPSCRALRMTIRLSLWRKIISST